MVKSSYISKNLTRPQMRLLQILDDYEVQYFSLSDLPERVGESVSEFNLKQIVENLHQKGFLIRIERGKYAKRQFSDVNVLASFISDGGIIAYWSALHQHGLTERFPNKIFVKTIYRKRNTFILGTPVQFVSVKPEKMIAPVQNGYGDLAYNMTDLETTIIDCFDQTRYAGGWEDLLKAFGRADLNSRKMVKYTKAYNRKGLIKRLGFLAEHFYPEKLAGFIDYARKNVGKKYMPLEPGGPQKGTFNSTWRLRINMDIEALVSFKVDGY